jgi:hypothetical protein
MKQDSWDGGWLIECRPDLVLKSLFERTGIFYLRESKIMRVIELIEN